MNRPANPEPKVSAWLNPMNFEIEGCSKGDQPTIPSGRIASPHRHPTCRHKPAVFLCIENEIFV